MIYYEVSLEIDPSIVDALVKYMREKHIPEIYATGCFTHIHFDQLDDTHFRTCYLARDQAALDKYLSDYTAGFREDFGKHFPAGATPSRVVWREVERWGG